MGLDPKIGTASLLPSVVQLWPGTAVVSHARRKRYQGFPLEAAASLQSHLQDADQVFLLKIHPEALQGAQAGKASMVPLSRAKLFQPHDKQISAQAASRSTPV